MRSSLGGRQDAFGAPGGGALAFFVVIAGMSITDALWRDEARDQ